MEDNDDDPLGHFDREVIQRRKESNARSRRLSRLQDVNYLSRIPNAVGVKPGKQLKHLSAQQVSKLSVSTYFRSCESLGLVPKVPKSVVHDEHNDEEGILSTVLDLQDLELSDQDLESWSTALFSEVTLLQNGGLPPPPAAGRDIHRTRPQAGGGAPGGAQPTKKKKGSEEEDGEDGLMVLLPALRLKALRLGANSFSDRALAKFLNGFLKPVPGKKETFALEELSFAGLAVMSHLSMSKVVMRWSDF